MSSLYPQTGMRLLLLCLIASLLYTSSCINSSEKAPPEDNSLALPTTATHAEEIEANTIGNFINLSDIHFNPLYHKSLAKALNSSPVAAWDSIFRTIGTNDFGTFDRHPHKNDSPYALFESALDTLKHMNLNPEFIVISGDLQGYNFETIYQSELPHTTTQDMHVFTEKTVQFIGMRIAHHFPNVPIFPALGNNDSYTWDYDLQPDGGYLKAMRKNWSALVKKPGVVSTFDTDFDTGGYYITSLPNQPEHKIMVLNTVFLTNDYIGNQGIGPATKMMQWAKRQMAANRTSPKKATFWLMYHVAPGLDPYGTILATGNPECNNKFFMNTTWNQKFTQFLVDNADQIELSLAGHSHMNNFKIVTKKSTDDSLKPVGFIHVTPSISPFNHNNPAIQWMHYDKSNFTLYNAESWYFKGIATPGMNVWEKEYVFQSTYGQPDMTLNSMVQAHHKLKSDIALQKKFVNYYFSENSEDQSTMLSNMNAMWCIMGNLLAEEYLKCKGCASGGTE